MPEKYIAPERNKPEFHCPNCEVYAAQSWSPLDRQYGRATVPNLSSAQCSHCKSYSLWYGKQQIWPITSSGPLPNEDLSEEIQTTYNEARAVISMSPRSAAALLRLCVQMLCVQLGKPGKNINDDIGALVKDGLPGTIQQALDVLRVTGNNAVHPGQIDLTDDREIVMQLFEFLNLVAENQLTQPRQVREAFGKLPASNQQQIAQRDNNAGT